MVAKIKVGDVYEDCSYHPVYCTESDGDIVSGVSLFDGSSPRSCSLRHCGVVKLSTKEVVARVARRRDWLAAEVLWHQQYSAASDDNQRTQASKTYHDTLNELSSRR